MWQTEYSDEAEFYFLNNAPYTFPLLVRLEELKFLPDAIPPEGLTPVDDPDEPEMYLWEVLDHMVALDRQSTERVIYYHVVKPLE